MQFEFPSQVCLLLFPDPWTFFLQSPQDDANGGRQSKRRDALLAFKKRASGIKREVESDMQASVNDYVRVAFSFLYILRRWPNTGATPNKR